MLAVSHNYKERDYRDPPFPIFVIPKLMKLESLIDRFLANVHVLILLHTRLAHSVYIYNSVPAASDMLIPMLMRYCQTQTSAARAC